MPTYRVLLTGHASATITITTDSTDPHEIAELALEEGVHGLCASCSGWGQTWSLDIEDGWEPVTKKDGTPEIYEEDSDS